MTMSNKGNAESQQCLLHVCFESRIIFEHNVYFNYNGIDFKLIKGTKQYQDVLCCIFDISSSSGPEFDKTRKRVEGIAFEFLSCLSWELKTGIVYCPAGGCGWSQEHGGLSSVTRKTCTSMPRQMSRHIKGISIVGLPKIGHDKYKAHALSLFREAKASNSPYYRFLCYWKILEIHNFKGGKSMDWINETVKHNTWILERAHFNKSILNNKKISNYLKDECRHAIAHVMPKYKLKPDSGESLFKIYTANIIVEHLVDIFIRKELGFGLTKDEKGNYLYLRKCKGKAIPSFASYRD